VLQHDRRPPLAEATLDVLFALLSQHSAHWDDAAWRVLLQRVMRHMLALPPGLAGEGGAGEVGAAQAQTAVARAEEDGLVLAMLRRMDRYFPLLCEQIGLISNKYRVRMGPGTGRGLAWDGGGARQRDRQGRMSVHWERGRRLPGFVSMRPCCIRQALWLLHLPPP
jgi:hypothetical protein